MYEFTTSSITAPQEEMNFEGLQSEGSERRLENSFRNEYEVQPLIVLTAWRTERIGLTTSNR